MLKDALIKINEKFKIYDPWKAEQEIIGLKEVSRWSAGNNQLTEAEKKELAEEIIANDLRALTESDLIIAYVFKISVGTSMEIFYMNRVLSKPVIIVFIPSEESETIPLWLYAHANLVFHSKRSLISWLKKELEKEND